MKRLRYRIGVRLLRPLLIEQLADAQDRQKRAQEHWRERFFMGRYSALHDIINSRGL